jgi:hypothetical protein
MAADGKTGCKTIVEHKPKSKGRFAVDFGFDFTKWDENYY